MRSVWALCAACAPLVACQTYEDVSWRAERDRAALGEAVSNGAEIEHGAAGTPPRAGPASGSWPSPVLDAGLDRSDAGAAAIAPRAAGPAR